MGFRAKIRHWNAELQERVEERTAELKVAQDQILRARRLAALGSMGAGIAHELNNPLTSISGLAVILSLDPKVSQHEETLKLLRGEVKRVAKICSRILPSFGLQVVTPRPPKRPSSCSTTRASAAFSPARTCRRGPPRGAARDAPPAAARSLHHDDRVLLH